MDTVGGDSIGATGIDSEEYFAHACGSCRQDGIEKKADIYCPTCDENLCSVCMEWHNKSKATRTHEVQPMSSARDHQIATSEESDDTMSQITTLCSCNLRCEVSEFCSDHQEVVCSTCASVKHRTCKVSSIDEMCSDESVVKTFNLTTEKVDDLANKASEIKSNQKSCLNDLQETEARCKTEIGNYKADLMNRIETLEKDALADLQSIIKQQNTILQTADTSAENALTLLKVDQKLLENAKKVQNKRQMFISNIQVEKSLQHYEEALSAAESKLRVPGIDFEKNEELSVILQESERLGQVKTREVECRSGKEKESFLGLQATYITSVDVKQSGGQNKPIISGFAFLHNDDLLIVDYIGSFLTLLDPTFKVKDSIKCTSSPWDIAVVSDEEVVVTVPGHQTLRFYRVSPKLQVVRNIKIDGSGLCWGVTVANNCVYVSCGSSEILILDTKGNRLRSITTGQTGIRFQGPSYIALNRSGNKLYYSDCSGSQLICMTTDGLHIYTNTNSDLVSPRGLIVDNDDNVVIACEGSNNMHVVRADGTKHNVLITPNDGIQKPMGIAYRSSTKTLVVGEWSGEKLKIFYLK